VAFLTQQPLKRSIHIRAGYAITGVQPIQRRYAP
jgi:hypothetical protein